MSAPLVLVGCGILQKEVDFLIRKNGWPVMTCWLRSALHNYFDQLYKELDQGLLDAEQAGQRAVAFYGACHPRMDQLLQSHHTCRTEGQNCVAMLLGYELFMERLCQGSYFLLEDWALSWEPMITECFGPNISVIREIFHASHKTMVAIRTPCSGDFAQAAEAAARLVDLPLEWMEVDLDHLERVLAAVIAQTEPQDPPR